MRLCVRAWVCRNNQKYVCVSVRIHNIRLFALSCSSTPICLSVGLFVPVLACAVFLPSQAADPTMRPRGHRMCSYFWQVNCVHVRPAHSIHTEASRQMLKGGVFRLNCIMAVSKTKHQSVNVADEHRLNILQHEDAYV